jgi:hypothetical protein
MTMVKIIFSWLNDELPDLRFWNIPTHPRDFLHYSEVLNGRIAMIVLSVILWLEFISKESIWSLVNVF